MTQALQTREDRHVGTRADELIGDSTDLLGPCEAQRRSSHLRVRVGDVTQVRHEQGHHERAGAEFADVLAARRRVLGANHPKTLNTCHDLAQLRYDQGHFTEAAAAYTEVLAARRRILGDDHLKTFATRHGLTVTLDELGQRDSAIAELRDVLEARRRVLGDDHPDTRASTEALRRAQR